MKAAHRLIVAAIAVFVLMFGTSVSAFKDVQQGKDQEKLMALKERGIIQGDGSKFHGNKKLTYAEGVHMIVKGMDLSLAAFLFMEAPKASDWFTKVKDNAWYSGSFVIAGAHDIGLPKDVDPQAEMTREAYIHYLFNAMMKTGDYAFTKMLVPVADEKDVNPNYMGDIQNMLNARIVVLDDEGNLFPKRAITRHEAAVILHDAIKFVEKHREQVPPGGVTVDQPISVSTVKVNDEVNKVTLTWGEKPNAGYRVEIKGVEFSGKIATVLYALHVPQEGEMYAEVITLAEDHTFVDAKYNVETRLVN